MGPWAGPPHQPKPSGPRLALAGQRRTRLGKTRASLKGPAGPTTSRARSSLGRCRRPPRRPALAGPPPRYLKDKRALRSAPGRARKKARTNGRGGGRLAVASASEPEDRDGRMAPPRATADTVLIARLHPWRWVNGAVIERPPTHIPLSHRGGFRVGPVRSSRSSAEAKFFSCMRHNT
jgi:hypothetical protein